MAKEKVVMVMIAKEETITAMMPKGEVATMVEMSKSATARKMRRHPHAAVSSSHTVSSHGLCKKAVEAAIKFRHSIQMNASVYKAPPELKAKVRAELRKVSKSETGWISELRRPLLYAAAVLLVCLLSISAWIATSQDRERVLIAQAISNHSHSLLADHLLDVTASDQHVVKAWFTGKLDYSPPVADLSEAGYKLVGGRLDMLENRPVAAIVYWHQDHVINEFVWPAARRGIDFDVQSHQGYSLCAWNKSGFNYLIVRI